MTVQAKFKETEIGKIPEDWGIKKVEDFCEKITSGGTPSRRIPDYWKNGTIPWLKTQELLDNNIYNTEEKITNLGFKNSSAKFFPPNTVIMAMYGATVGKLAILKVESTTNQACCAMIPNENISNHMFLFYALLNYRGKIINLACGAAQQNLNQDIIKSFKLPFPPKMEQDKIASILSSLDDEIALNRSMNSTLEAIGQALFRRWFVDFEFPNEEDKPYISSGGEMVETELGEVPMGWRVGTLGDYVNVIKGCSYRSEDLQDSGKALVTLKAIERGGGFKLDGLKPYTGEYKDEQIISPGELVVAHTDLTQKAEVLGKPAIVRKVPLYSTLIASLDLSVVRPKNDSTNVPFVYFFLKTEDFQNHAYGYADGTTVLHLNKKAVPDYKFVLPQKDLVKKFGNIIIELLNKIQNNELESEVLISIRDALLPKLMSGEIRIKT